MNTLTRKTIAFIISVLFVGWFCINAGNVLATPANLTLGSRGDEVVQLQQGLNDKGYYCGEADGIFGSKTLSAVKQFQNNRGLTADGIVGPQTRNALNLSSAIKSTDTSQASYSGNLKQGSRGDAVAKLQNLLNRKDFYCGAADGIFGAKTYNAVVKFQQSCGLAADGIVGPRTRTALGLSNATVSAPSRDTTQVSRGSRVITIVATGYCPCNKCNYPYGGKPSYLGYPLARGIAAVDSRVIPMGSRLYIEGYGNAIAADKGGAIVGNRIDLCFDTHQEALNWGIRTVKVTVYN